MIPKRLAGIVDGLLEATVVLSFSNVGYRWRRPLLGWGPPSDLRGRTVVVTGATSGLGFEAAAECAEAGASVLLVARNAAKATAVMEQLRNRVGRDAFTFFSGDLGSLASVRSCAAAILAHTDRVDVVIHNAGALDAAYQQGPDGTEQTIATHVLGPFLLTQLLEPALAAAAPGRVVWVTSGGMYSWRFDLAELELSEANYDGVKAYAHAKRAQVMLAHEWARRCSPDTMLFATMHPGWTDTPGLATSLPRFYQRIKPWLRTPAQGVDTLCWLASTPDLAAHNGRLFFDRRPRSEHKGFTRTRHPEADEQSLWQWCDQRTNSATDV